MQNSYCRLFSAFSFLFFHIARPVIQNAYRCKALFKCSESLMVHFTLGTTIVTILAGNPTGQEQIGIKCTWYKVKIMKRANWTVFVKHFSIQPGFSMCFTTQYVASFTNSLKHLMHTLLYISLQLILAEKVWKCMFG